MNDLKTLIFIPNGGSDCMLSNNIHVWRAEKKLTQQQLADIVGVSRQTIVALEKNKYNPSFILAVKVANALEKPVMEVFSYEEE